MGHESCGNEGWTWPGRNTLDHDRSHLSAMLISMICLLPRPVSPSSLFPCCDYVSTCTERYSLVDLDVSRRQLADVSHLRHCFALHFLTNDIEMPY